MSESSGRGFPPQPPPTKSILVYRNGDAFYPGKKFVINQRQTATFESFLGSVTRGIEAPFGAVRHIYTPREGHRIRSLEQFSHGERYVAAGAERLKNIDYLHITPNRPQRMKNKQIRPVVHSKIIVPARWRKNINEPCTINVFANGDILVPPARILLPKYTLNSWESVLAMVTEKVHLRSGAVHRLFTLDGTPLLGTAELKNNQYYVAVGMEKFRHKPYVQNIPNKGLILDINQAIINEILPPLKRGKPPRDLFADRPEGNADTHFYAQPDRGKQRGRGLKSPHLYTAQEDSVFRANDKRKEVVGVSEVQDDSDMKVDLPIDQMEAKTVEEEQVEDKYPRPQNGGQSPRRAVLRRSALNTPRSPSVISYKTSVNGSTAGESESGSHLAIPRGESGLEPEHKGTKGVEASSEPCGVRSRMSKFFKSRFIKAA
ncbi:doublecortin domain-containing protein 2 isoform X2 [Astyanax mexicanus]|uniref:Doublecortin domain-containing protein 2 isoform X2 n=1 Tax=Astyanax mexicanus TaxID=7994 RepID=A0A8T2LA39_ASTMX|nr:doublecortin domain-containing protein 2 isoform X2 [Astyanax mexicanus]